MFSDSVNFFSQIAHVLKNGCWRIHGGLKTIQWNSNSLRRAEDRAVDARLQMGDKLRIGLESRQYSPGAKATASAPERRPRLQSDGLGAGTVWLTKSCRFGVKKSTSIVSSVQTNS